MRKDLLIIVFVFTLISSAFFLFTKVKYASLNTVYKSWDGPSYVIAAQSLYVPQLAVTLNTIRSPEIRQDFTFLPAHFPLYPLLIRAFSFVGYYQAMLLIALLFSLGFVLAFYFLARQLNLGKPLFLTLPLLILPPRWFIVSHTGSSEPIFLFFVILSLLFYYRKSPWLSAITGSLALLARPQGALLGLAYLVIAGVDLYRSQEHYGSNTLPLILKRYSPYLLLPLTLILIFGFYLRQTGDFWAFFRAISVFHHFRLALFPTFNYGAANIETFWQEANVMYYLLYLFTIIKLLARTKHYQLGILGIIFYLPLIFLQHTDISRYSLPLMPLVFIAFAPSLSDKKFTFASFLLLPAIFLYALNFMLNNHAP